MVSASSVSASGAAEQVEAKPPKQPLSLELNLAWPFLGISEARLLVPLYEASELRGKLVTGIHLDFMQLGRETQGQFRNYAVKLGYRQYFWRGLHAELASNLGWVHLTNNPVSGGDYDALGLSGWLHVGYEWTLGDTFYINARPTLGYRILNNGAWPNSPTSPLINGFVDVNLGMKF